MDTTTPATRVPALLPILLVLTPNYRQALYWVRDHAPTRRWMHVTSGRQVVGRWPVEWVDLAPDVQDAELVDCRRGLLRMATLGGAVEWSPPHPHRDLPISSVTMVVAGIRTVSNYSGPNAADAAERLAAYWRQFGRTVTVTHTTATAGPQ
jgi:hypothetical protein